MRLTPCICLLLLPTIALATPFPGGILDSTGRTAYVRSTEGIAAIDLARGDVLWHRREAHVPLLVAGDRLYALALSSTNRLSVLAFDLASKAENVFQTDVTDLPRWVSTLDQPGKEFRFRWSREHRILKLQWFAQARTTGSPAKKASGELRIDLDSGRVRTEAPRGNTPDDLTPSVALPAQLQRFHVRWNSEFGGQLVAVVLEDLADSKAGARKQQLVFRGWDLRTGRESAKREMLKGQQLTVVADVDGKHLWLRDIGAGRGPGQADQPERHHWTVYSGLDGHEVARVPFVPGTTSSTILGRRAYCLSVSGRRSGVDRQAVVRHTLHAIDLTTGKPLWTCSLSQ